MRMTSGRTGDKTKECIQCGRAFTFSLLDHIRYKENRWNEPKRCSQCREVKRKMMQCEDPYLGWETIAPGLYKVEFKGGFDVTGHTVRLRY